MERIANQILAQRSKQEVKRLIVLLQMDKPEYCKVYNRCISCVTKMRTRGSKCSGCFDNANRTRAKHGKQKSLYNKIYKARKKREHIEFLQLCEREEKNGKSQG